MELKLRKTQEIYIIDISGELDLYNTNQLTELFGKLTDRGVSQIIINMEGVSYLDSSGVGSLITIYHRVQQKNLEFAICNVAGTALKVMELTRLTTYFPIKGSCEEAIQALSRPQA